MKFSQKLSIALFGVTTSLFSLSSGALAGEGAAAGSAAFTLDATTSNVTGVAVAASVGKNDASAAAFNDVTNGLNSAFALGSSGLITVDKMGDPTNAVMVGTADTQLGVDQGNSLTGSATVQLGTTSGDAIVTTPDATP